MDGVAIFVDNRLRFIDHAATAMAGYSREQDALGSGLACSFPPEVLEAPSRGGQAAAGPFRVKIPRPDGSTSDLEAWSLPALYEGASAVEVILHPPANGPAPSGHAARLALLGEMVACVAHELGNSLVAILATAAAAERQEGPRDLRASLRRVAAEARRATATVTRLLGFARRQPAAREATDLNRLVRETLELGSRLLGASGTTLRVDLDPALPLAAVNPQQFQGVLLDLLRNADQAIATAGRGGAIDVSTRSTGDAIAIRVADNGVGIPSHAIAAIFEPFFTTKEPGHGTGLGLAVSRRIVRDHGGDIHVESVPGRGAAFTVTLPIAPPAPGPPATPEPPLPGTAP